jgi:hypothetical protein
MGHKGIPWALAVQLASTMPLAACLLLAALAHLGRACTTALGAQKVEGTRVLLPLAMPRQQ